MEPSIIYTKLLVSISGGYSWEPACEISAAVHITGGGIPGKLARLLHGTPYGATLEQLYAPPEVMLLAQKEGAISDEEAYRVWNMGQGLLIITSNPEAVILAAKKLNFEARVAGMIDSSRGIRIRSSALKKQGEWLEFDREN